MTLSETQRILVKEAYAAFFRAPTNAQKAHAKTVMGDCDAPATAVLIAAKHLLGPTFLSYEPETLWLELEPCANNRDKLMAGIALAMTPSFYWDYRVFGATVHALNNEQVDPGDVPRCSPAQMAWAAFEAELLFALTDGESTKPEYDPSVEAYVATSLFEDGLVVCPVGLNFAHDELKHRLPADALPLQAEVEKAWSALPKEKMTSPDFDDTAMGAQLHRLADAWRYVAERTKVLRTQLASL